jgi:hypothetical protein
MCIIYVKLIRGKYLLVILLGVYMYQPPPKMGAESAEETAEAVTREAPERPIAGQK